MELDFFIQGIVIGFSIAAPVGPIGVLCIRRTLAEGRATGLASGLGAATADALYGCVAAFGLTFISNILIGHRLWLRLGGGAFLICLGLRTLLSRPVEQFASVTSNGLAGAYGSTFLLTLTNPMTILFFAGVMAGLGVDSAAHDYTSATVLVTGVFIGSALWWLTLSSGVSWLKWRVNTRTRTWINRTSGAIIIAFGVIALLQSMK
jgi:threonine/homoserine/homoserine lactone efflux protein